ncbi:trans-sulfuration enzyme family protein [Cohnella terricola]|uniref:homocysteine desulfhydrase n=1 Tax=Cohnella terricola TaxID=1289167 RepID=A0A559JWD9_9BACL|nr:PLP-dependent aspartate aminotransferase family protein [Cohnella terricola]TVY04205.1 PLP-dependent transferase [Cohnella terricola]
MSVIEKRKTLYTAVAADEYDTRHHGAINFPLYQNSLFAFETHEAFDRAMADAGREHHIYSRGNNPTVRYLEEKISELEGGESAKCFASGMGAISAAVLSIVAQGDHIVCVNQAYGPTREFLGSYLQRFGIETTFVDGSLLENWRNAVRPNTKLFYLESPTTMMFELQDIPACTELAKQIGAATIIDGTWATPCFQQPLAMGVDLVIHSISKYLSGHSDCIGGVVIGSNRWMDRLSRTEYMLFGGVMTAHTAAAVMRGLRTLPLRMERHESSGLRVAMHLSNQPYVTRVNHPGLPFHPQYDLARRQLTGYSSLFSFESNEPPEKLKEFANRLGLFKIGVSWGGYESLITVNRVQPDQSSDEKVVVRVYVGLEDPDDLIQDIDAAWASLN